jgi:hypothetical protein
MHDAMLQGDRWAMENSDATQMGSRPVCAGYRGAAEGYNR